jgi:peptidoglycan/LPS O-acetylase OafA/YrhL
VDLSAVGDNAASGIVSLTPPRRPKRGMRWSTATDVGPFVSARIGYVPGLDGIRGTAILLVLAYHFLGLPGGFYGVDLFFVLSGFLITTLLLQERTTTGRVSFGKFYARRARRLLPALVAVLGFACFMALVPPAGSGPEYGRLAIEGVLACLLYAANVFRMLGHLLPINLTPMWSLAEEEQFYFLWPALFVLLSRRLDARRLAAVLFALAIAVSAWRAGVTLTDGATGRVYFGPDMRCSGLLLGSALAAARAAGLRLPRIPFGSLAALAAIGALAVFAHGSSEFAYAAGFPLAEVAGIVLILAALGGSRNSHASAARLGRNHQLRGVRLDGHRRAVRPSGRHAAAARDRRGLGVHALHRASIQTAAAAGDDNGRPGDRSGCRLSGQPAGVGYASSRSRRLAVSRASCVARRFRSECAIRSRISRTTIAPNQG